jgi:hypothetical protein
MFFEGHAALTDLHTASESRQQDREVEENTSAVKRGCIVLQVVKDTSDDEGHDGVEKHASDQDSHVSPKPLEASFHAQFHLHRKGENIGRLRSSKPFYQHHFRLEAYEIQRTAT